MSENDLVVVDIVAGDLQAQLLRGLLEAQGIAVMLSEESAAITYGLQLAGFANVQLIVRSDQAEQARQLLDEYYTGKLEGVELLEDDHNPGGGNLGEYPESKNP